MPTLTMSQIADAAYAGGFRGDKIVTAVAVAMAESSGRSDVVNSIGCVGLWQINQPVHKWAGTQTSLKNPAMNARAAYIISKSGTTWLPWEAYTRGMHLKYMDAARKAVAQSTSAGWDQHPQPNLIEAVDNLNPLSGLATLTELLSDPKFWIRVLYVVAGILITLVIVARITKADSLLPLGKIAKLAKVVL